MKLWYKT